MTSASGPSIDVPDSVDAPSHARAFVATQIEHLDKRARDIIELLVSEVVTNAYRHGRPPVRVSATVRRSIARVEVHDLGTTFAVPTIGMKDLATSGGWGLAIVAALATSWGITPGPRGAGKFVWFEFDATGPFPDLPGITR